jgi:hypothetical protein
MKKRNHLLTSNYIYKIRREENIRILETGSNLPNRPSLFDSSVKLIEGFHSTDSSIVPPSSKPPSECQGG